MKSTNQLMHSLVHWLSCGLIGLPIWARADIDLDSKFAWDINKPNKQETWIKPADINNTIKQERERRNALSPMERAFEDGGTSPITEAINRDQIAQGFKRKSYETLNFFHMLWNGGSFYVAGTQYISREQQADIQRSTTTGESEAKTIPGGGICTLFIYDGNLKQVAKHDVKLNEADGKTWCNGANALARVRGQDALLFSISYYLTDKPLSKKAKDIGNDWRYMTVLLRLQEQDGKVTIEQDDSCLRNPNTYTNIPSARKALARCAH